MEVWGVSWEVERLLSPRYLRHWGSKMPTEEKNSFMRIYYCYQVSVILGISVRCQFTTYLPSKNLLARIFQIRSHATTLASLFIKRILELRLIQFVFHVLHFYAIWLEQFQMIGNYSWRVQLTRQALLYFKKTDLKRLGLRKRPCLLDCLFVCLFVCLWNLFNVGISVTM